MDIADITSTIEERWRAATKHHETLVGRTNTKSGEMYHTSEGCVVHRPIFKERQKRLVKEREGNEWANSPNCLLKSNIQPQKREILEGNAGDDGRKREDNRKTCMVVGMGEYLVEMVLRVL